MRWLPVTIFSVLVVVAGGLIAMWLLGVWADAAPNVTATDAEQLRLDKVKTGLTVAAGLGAGITLFIALRKQSIHERAQRFIESDAEEDRITALYATAVEQIGSEKAAVRLGGLYALERLGQDNPKLRQTVTDVICAYLRMPYTLPTMSMRPGEGNAIDDGADGQRQQELQVRLTAQRVLATHTRVAPGGRALEPNQFWQGPGRQSMNLDLAGASLVDFDLNGCRVGVINLKGACLHGPTDLTDTVFLGEADFSEARFLSACNLSRAQFQAYAKFSNARFSGETQFVKAQFHRFADLNMSKFEDLADLSGVEFHDYANLNGAEFYASAHLSRARFRRYVNLSRTTFFGNAYFSGVTFFKEVSLGRARFEAQVDFGEASFRADADLVGAQFHVPAQLAVAEYFGKVDLTNASVVPGSEPPFGWMPGSPTQDGLVALVARHEAPGAAEEPTLDLTDALAAIRRTDPAL